MYRRSWAMQRSLATDQMGPWEDWAEVVHATLVHTKHQDAWIQDLARKMFDEGYLPKEAAFALVQKKKGKW